MAETSKSTTKEKAAKTKKESLKEQEKLLNRELEDFFPASDPLSLTQPTIAMGGPDQAPQSEVSWLIRKMSLLEGCRDLLAIDFWLPPRMNLTIGNPCDRYLILRRVRAFGHHEFAKAMGEESLSLASSVASDIPIRRAGQRRDEEHPARGIDSIDLPSYVHYHRGKLAFVEGAFGAIRCDSGGAGPFCYSNNARAYCYVFVHCNGSRIGICKTEI